jgi:hypothetical protein
MYQSLSQLCLAQLQPLDPWNHSLIILEYKAMFAQDGWVSTAPAGQLNSALPISLSVVTHLLLLILTPCPLVLACV